MTVAANAQGAAAAAAAIQSVYRQLQQSERWSADALQAAQLQQLGLLVEHAWDTVPYYRARLEKAGIGPDRDPTPAEWRRLPLLTRRDIQEAGDALLSTDIPAEHGDVITAVTSGSTGTPVKVAGTILDACFAKAFALRHYFWHPFDFRLKNASIKIAPKGKADYPDGAIYNRWGEAGAFPFRTGPAAALDIGASIDKQIDWLQRVQPAYLTTYPTNLRALIERTAATGVGFPRLRHVTTVGEVLDDHVRKACLKAWGIMIYDIYSAMEIGVMALQCPKHNHYHLQAENALIEVIDDDGEPCGPGERGRVVVTPLRNFAMPLLRYEIGDYAEVGPACDCGRAHPVVKRFMGRSRNMLIAPDGAKYFPFFGANKFTDIAPVVQHQFVQREADRLEARMVVRRPLSGEEQDALRDRILTRLPCRLAIDFVFVDELPRSAGGKFEEFRSEIAA